MPQILALTLFLLLGSMSETGPARAEAVVAMDISSAGMADESLPFQAIEIAGLPDMPRDQPLAARDLAFERTALPGGLAHYRLDLPVGPGEHDIIRLHRIVRERAPWVPARTRRGAFLLHGDAWGFEATYLTSLGTPAVPDSLSLPAVLAGRGVDVWGLDFRWARVPAETEDLSFMADWGFETQLHDLEVGLGIARSVRLLTGSGFSPLHLVGFSRGGQLGWAYVAAETQKPRSLRLVSSFISLDNAFKTDDEEVLASNCASYASIESQLAAGSVVSDFTILAEIGDLATAAPDDPSPFFPSLGNADLAEWIGASEGGGSIPHFHSVGGVVDPDTFVTELSYTQPEMWFSFLSQASAYQPLRINLDGAAIGCEEIDSPYDDHLADITLPVFHIGAAGAYGELGLYTLGLIGSSNVESLIVEEAAEPELAYGHNDLTLATGAETLVWRPILEWIRAH